MIVIIVVKYLQRYYVEVKEKKMEFNLIYKFKII